MEVLLFIDIETLPDGERAPLTNFKAPANYKDEQKIYDYLLAEQEEEYRGRSTKSAKGKIAVICAAVNDEPVKSFCLVDYQNEEGLLLKAFDDWLKEKRAASGSAPFKWIAHNGKLFDFVWFLHRAIKYKLFTIRNMVPSERYDKRCYDTMENWAATNWADKTKLDEIARFLGLETKTMDGSQVFDEWNKNPNTVVEYCAHEVGKVLRPVFYAMMQRA